MTSDTQRSELLPCPFCSAEIPHTESWARSFQPPKLYHEYRHPSNDCVALHGQMWQFTDDAEPRQAFIAAWNRRTPPKVGSGELDAAEAARISDAVLSWMVKYDLLDASNEYRAEDVVEVLNDLAPALAAPVDHPEVVGVKIKPLEWVKHPAVEAWRAETLVGLYQVWAVKGISWELSARESTGGKAETVEAAKAAAQQDFETRIRSALTAASLPERVADDSYPDPSDLVAVNKALREQVSELCAALQPSDSPALEAGVATHRHVKSGHLVRVIGVGKMQSGNWYETGIGFRAVDMRPVVIYEHDGNLWARPVEEFNDGRFAALAATAKEEGK
jgi:hypothetical protein